jgi:hypothetical protein
MKRSGCEISVSELVDNQLEVFVLSTKWIRGWVKFIILLLVTYCVTTGSKFASSITTESSAKQSERNADDHTELLWFEREREM